MKPFWTFYLLPNTVPTNTMTTYRCKGETNVTFRRFCSKEIEHFWLKRFLFKNFRLSQSIQCRFFRFGNRRCESGPWYRICITEAVLQVAVNWAELWLPGVNGDPKAKFCIFRATANLFANRWRFPNSQWVSNIAVQCSYWKMLKRAICRLILGATNFSGSTWGSKRWFFSLNVD